MKYVYKWENNDKTDLFYETLIKPSWQFSVYFKSQLAIFIVLVALTNTTIT